MTGIGIDIAGVEGTPKLRARMAAVVSAGANGFALTALEAAPTDAWAALAERDVADNIFFDPDFVLPLVRYLGGAVSLATVRAGDGTLIAAAPAAKARLGRVAPAIRLFGNAYAPLGAPLLDRTAVEAAAGGLVEGLAAGGRSLIVPDMALDGAVAAALRDAARRTQRPVAVIGAHRRSALNRPAAGAANPRDALSAKRRGEYRRQMLRLADQGVVAIAAHEGAAAVGEAFAAFLALEAAGWKGRGGTALLSHQATADFARAALTALAARGKARVDAIRVAGKPVAMLVSFISGATAYSWKIAYDEDYARFSPGAQLMLEAGRAIFAGSPAARIDSCAVADHPMVDHVWKDRVAIGTMIIGPTGGGSLFAAGLAVAKAEIAARAIVRKLKRRHGQAGRL